ncbi:ABC transporter permease, partial [Vibrio splendidus]
MLKPIAAAVFLVVLCVMSLMIGVAEISFSDFFNGNQHANSI